MRFVRPAVRVSALGAESRPSAFLFNDGSRRAIYKFRSQFELDELAALLAGMADGPLSARLQMFVDQNWEMFDEVDAAAAYSLISSHQSRQLSYFACAAGVGGAIKCLAKLEQAKVLILGVGGVGSHLAEHLVRIGVRKFILVDFDTVERSNLNRQTLYTSADVGRKKTEAASARLRQIEGGQLDISCHDRFFPELIHDLELGPAMVFVSADSAPFELGRAVVAEAFPRAIPYAFLGYIGERAVIRPLVFDKSAGCGCCAVMSGKPEEWFRPLAAYKALDMPPSSYAINAVVAALAADMWTRHLAGGIEGSVELEVSMRDHSISRAIPRRDRSCPVCGHDA